MDIIIQKLWPGFDRDGPPCGYEPSLPKCHHNDGAPVKAKSISSPVNWRFKNQCLSRTVDFVNRCSKAACAFEKQYGKPSHLGSVEARFQRASYGGFPAAGR